MSNVSVQAPKALKILWEEGTFKSWMNQEKVAQILGNRGNNFPVPTLRMALFRAPYLTRRKENSIFEYIQKRPAISKEIANAASHLFDVKLLNQLGKTFAQEVDDLHLNFGKSGNCTAFILRKILEKLIYIAFAKKGLESKLEDKTPPGMLVGLNAMVNISSQEKSGGIPFLTPSTAREIKGIKFLGDAAAHNPLVDVDIRTILPQMPFIITAYKELSRFL